MHDDAIASSSVLPSGIVLHEEVGRGAESIVYRGTRDGAEFAVKFYVGPLRGADALRLYRREAAIHAGMRHPSIPAIFEVGIHDGRPYLLSEFVRGQTLAARLTKGPLGVALTVDVARGLAEVLGAIHMRGLVHRDIKPRNILLSRENQIRLLDFGLAGEAHSGAEMESTGTFLYSSPEQLGVLERPVDARADLYALGGVLYECIAGAPPFVTHDLSELLHRHGAVRPARLDVAPERCDHALAEIIDRLLRKDPDERFQSAGALLRDLGRLTELRDRARRGEPLQLTLRDTGFTSRGAFVGRDAELEDLTAWLSVRDDRRARALLVSGPSGSGKTRLIERALEFLHGSDTLVLRGRCEPRDPYPFAALREAIDEHLRGARLLGDDAHQVALERLREAAGHLAPILRQLGPELGRALAAGPSQEAPRDASDLFFHALTTFLLELSERAGRLVLWVDDIQWLDPASHEALTLLASRAADRPITLLFSARDDVESASAVEAFARSMQPLGMRAQRLGPLDAPAVGRLIVAELGATLDDDLVRRIAGRSQGSPLVVHQYARIMRDAGVLIPSWGTWVVDEAALASVPLPDNIVELLTNRLSFLGETARAVLSVAAFLGSEIEVETLTACCAAHRPREVRRAIAEALDAQLIERMHLGERYKFAHDRIRETLLTLISDRSEIHRAAARHLDGLAVLTERQVFDRAWHYREALAQEAPLQTLRACLDAAVRAADRHDHARSYEVLDAVRGIGPWEALDPELRKLLHRTIGAACFQTERVDEAVEHFHAALALTEGSFERAALRAHIARAAIFTFNTREGTREIERAFEELGRTLPSVAQKDPQALQATLFQMLEETLSVVEAPRPEIAVEERAVAGAIIDLCGSGFLTGYYNRNLPFAMQCGILALTPAWQLGESSASCQGYATFAWLMGLLGRRELVDRFARRAIGIARSLGDRQALADTLSTCAIAMHMGGDVDEAYRLQREVFDRYVDWLGPIAFQNCCVDLSWQHQIRGYADEELRVSQAAIHRLENRGGLFMAGYCCRASGAAMSAAATLSQMSQAAGYLRAVERFRAIVPPDRTVPWVSIAGWEVNYFAQQDDFGPAFEEAVARHDAWQIPPARSALHSKHFYVFYPWALLEHALQSTPDARPALLATLRKAIDDLGAAATIPTMRAHHLVLRAALKVEDGEHDEAWPLLDEARREASAHDIPWVLYEEARVRARTLRRRGRTMAAHHEAQRAQLLATQHRWRARRLRAEAEFQLSRTPDLSSQRPPSTHTMAGSGSAEYALLQRKLDALLALSQASASVLNLSDLAQRVLDESVRILCAERAFLFMTDRDSGKLTFRHGRDAMGVNLSEPTEYSASVVERAFEMGRYVIVSTLDDADSIGSESVSAYGLRSVVAAPLMTAERVLGVIYLDNRLARGVFTQEHVELLMAMGRHMANKFETARAAMLEGQLKAERERRRLAETLRDLNVRLTSTLNLQESLSRLLEALEREIHFDGAVVTVREEDRLDPVIIQGSGAAVPGFYQEPWFLARHGSLHEPAALDVGTGASCLVFPLVSNAVVTGFVLLLRASGKAFSDNDRELGLTLTSHASVAIENARLFRRVKLLAERDGLTGLLNRREFFRRAEAMMAGDAAPGVILFDIDHFKQFNDLHGHAVGDEVLRHVARIFGEAFRDDDILGRYGGEEFAVVLPRADRTTIGEAAERLRAAVEVGDLAGVGAGALRVTISAGAAARFPSETLESLLSRADQALYASKRSGRNVITVS